MALEIKICGMTNADDVRAALDLGADYVGFVLYAKSPRGVTAGAMRRILDQVAGVRAVGVFVNTPADEVAQVADDCGLHAVQLHGDELPSAARSGARRVWRAVRFSNGAWQPDPAAWAVERFVVDAAVSGQYGGTGVRADWAAAAALASRVPVMLSGGLRPDNVAEAIARVRPLGVDVASGVEREPGRKDPAAVAAFIRAARAARSA